MQKKILNLIIGTAVIFAGFLAFTAQADASTTFNTNSLDFQTVRVSNYTVNPNCTNCWYSSVSATAGQIVAVEIYYHNTGSVTATDTRIKISPESTGPVTNQTFSGGVGASNASFANGSATINISGSPQTISFIPGTARLYKDQSFTPQYFSSAQEQLIFSGSGIPIGDILPGSTCPSTQTFCHQGTFVARFQVGNNTPVTYECNDGMDNDGDGLTDYPQDPGCSSPTDNSEYNAQTYECNDGIDNDGDGLVDYPHDPGCNVPNDNSEYNAPAVYQCNDGMDNDGDGLTDYSQDPGCSSPTDNSEYNVTATYQCNDGNDNDGDGLVDYPQDPGCSSYTDNSEYNVTATYQCNDGNDNDGDGLTDYPQDPGCSGYTDNSEYNTVNAYVNAVTEPESNVDEDSATLEGSYTTSANQATVWFEWGTTNSLGNQTSTQTESGSSGSFSRTISGLNSDDTYYYRACADISNAPQDCGQTLSFTTDDDNNNDDEPEAITRSATDVGDTYATLRGEAIAVDDNGDDDGEFYFEYGTTHSLGHRTNTEDFNGEEDVEDDLDNLYPNTTYYFRLVVRQSGFGTVHGETRSFVTDGNNNQPPNPSQGAPVVTTLVATSVAQTSVRLNGFLTSAGSTTNTVRFEWGPTSALGYTTTAQNLSTPTAYYDYLSNLAPNTVYYYRAVAQNQYGTSYGSVLNFITKTTGPQIIYINTGDTSGPLTSIDISPEIQEAKVGDTVRFNIEYKNLSSKTLKNAKLEVILPSGFDFSRATRGDISNSQNTLNVDLGSLNANTSGGVEVEAIVNDNVNDRETLVTTAILTYTTPSGTQEDATDYASVRITGGDSQFAGLALFSGFGGTLLGVLLAILIIMLIVYISRRTIR